MFACTCIDFLVQSVACKHTHAVKMLQSATSSGDIVLDSPGDVMDNDDNFLLDPSVKNDATHGHTYYKKILCKSKDEISRNLNQAVTTALKRMRELNDLLKNALNVDVV